MTLLISKLEAWCEHDFHTDRQLADEVLIADGWSCEPDETFEGGIRWFVGTNPQVSTSENTRPHPINDLNAAIGVVPYRYNWRLTMFGEQAVAQVWQSGEIFRDEFEGHAPIPTIALLIAALKATNHKYVSQNQSSRRKSWTG